MANIQKYSTAIEGSLKNDELEQINTDLAEVLLDSTLNDGTLKDIPFIGTIIGLVKVGNSVTDSLFVKKIVSFLASLGDTSAEKRKEMIEKIDSSKKYRTKVGEKLLYIIDKCDDHEQAEIMAKMFKAFILEKISYSDFIKAAKIIDKIPMEELADFVTNNYVDMNIEDGSEYLNWGLFEIAPINIRLEQVKEGTWDNSSGEHEIKGGKIETQISHIGRKIREILK